MCVPVMPVQWRVAMQPRCRHNKKECRCGKCIKQLCVIPSVYERVRDAMLVTGAYRGQPCIAHVWVVILHGLVEFKLTLCCQYSGGSSLVFVREHVAHQFGP